jgi:glycerol kinase
VDVPAAIRRASPGPLIALPLLAGDRTPTWNDAARAAVAGIGLATTAEDIATAMVEGVAYRVARLWEVTSRAMPGIDRVVATGGTLLALPWLIQLFADAIDRPLRMSLAGEGSARGAAIVALERIGALRDVAAVRSPLGRTFRPRRAVGDRLRAGMERQRQLEEALAPLMS